MCVSVRVSKSILLLGIRYGDGFSKIKLVTTTVHLVFGSFLGSFLELINPVIINDNCEKCNHVSKCWTEVFLFSAGELCLCSVM